jgi:hypothetical protein
MTALAPLSFLVHSSAEGPGGTGLREVARRGIRDDDLGTIKSWLLAIDPREPGGRCAAFTAFRIGAALHFGLAVVDLGFGGEQSGRGAGKLYLCLLTPERDDGSGLEALALVDCTRRLAENLGRSERPLDDLVTRLQHAQKRGIEMPAPDPEQLRHLPPGALDRFLHCAYLALPDPDRGNSSRPAWLLREIAPEEAPTRIAAASGALPLCMRHALSWSYDVAGAGLKGLVVRRAAPGEDDPPAPAAAIPGAYAGWLDARLAARDDPAILRIVKDRRLSSWDELLQAIGTPAAPGQPAHAATLEHPRDAAVRQAASLDTGTAAEAMRWNQEAAAIERRLRDYLDGCIDDLRRSMEDTLSTETRRRRGPAPAAVAVETAAGGSRGRRLLRTFALPAVVVGFAALAVCMALLSWRLAELGGRLDRLQHKLAAPAASTPARVPPLAPVTSDQAPPAGTAATSGNDAVTEPPRPSPANLAAAWQAFLADRQDLAALCKRMADDRLTSPHQRPFLTQMAADLQAGAPLSPSQEAALRLLLFEYAVRISLPGLRQPVNRTWSSRNLTDQQRAHLLRALSVEDANLRQGKPGPDWEQAVILRWAGRDVQ